MPSAVKLSTELVESARRESRLWSRSMTQQIEHWARIGRSIERSDAISVERIRAALSAELELDALDAEERAAATGQLEGLVFRPGGDADLARRLRDEGVPLSGVDADGRLVAHLPSGDIEPIGDVEIYARRRSVFAAATDEG